MKAYLRYNHAQAFGVVASAACNIISSDDDSVVYTGALETVHARSVRQGTLVRACCWQPAGRRLAQICRTTALFDIWLWWLC